MRTPPDFYEVELQALAINVVFAICIEPPRCEECGLPMEVCMRNANLLFAREAFARYVRAERRIVASPRNRA